MNYEPRKLVKTDLSDISTDSLGSFSMMENLREFMSINQLYSAAIKEIVTKLEILDDEFSVKYNYNPIHQIHP